MCGIAGFIAGHGAANAAALAPMLARIAHRGPDGQGTFVEGPAALGHCRLAIIDLEGGAQPVSYTHLDVYKRQTFGSYILIYHSINV